MNSQIYKKYNWQCASTELAIRTARVEAPGWVEPIKSATVCIMSSRIAGKNFAAIQYVDWLKIWQVMHT